MEFILCVCRCRNMKTFRSDDLQMQQHGDGDENDVDGDSITSFHFIACFISFLVLLLIQSTEYEASMYDLQIFGFEQPTKKKSHTQICFSFTYFENMFWFCCSVWCFHVISFWEYHFLVIHLVENC